MHVHGLAINDFRLLPVFITGLLQGFGALVDGLIPADFLPVIAARCTVERLRRTLLRVRDLTIAQSLAAKCTTVDWAV